MYLLHVRFCWWPLGHCKGTRPALQTLEEFQYSQANGFRAVLEAAGGKGLNHMEGEKGESVSPLMYSSAGGHLDTVKVREL